MQDSSLETFLGAREQARENLWSRNPRGTRLKLNWRASSVRHSFHLLPGESVLEFGAGSGTWTEQLAREFGGENELTAAVFSRELFEIARSRTLARAGFVYVTNLAEDLPSASFDYIVGSMILFHDMLPEALLAVSRLLRPGGQILFFEHNNRHPVKKLQARLGLSKSRAPLIFQPIADKRIVRACSHRGFTHIELAPYDFLPWGLEEQTSKTLQETTILCEHAPVLRAFSEGVYLWARKPGTLEDRVTYLTPHESLWGKVSVVIPCHNEEQNIPTLVHRLLALYGPYIHEIVIVNDNSTDRTAEVVEQIASTEPRVKLLNRQKPNGVGRALRDGYAFASGQYILSMDCDFIEILPEFRGLFTAIAGGRDGAIGSRFSHDSILINYPFPKMVFNRAFHALIRFTLVRRSRDLSNNLKLYRAKIFKELNIESPHFSANLETGLKPILAGYDICEVPISWINRTVGMGSSSFNIGKVGPDYAKALCRIWRQHKASKRRVNSTEPESCEPLPLGGHKK